MRLQDDIAIDIQNVSKYFKIYSDKAYTLKERILFWKRNKYDIKYIIKNINIKIKKGEIVALIGTNGSGKSTILKLITKILYPSEGKITVNGKITSMIELGAGFHPDFSGIENIYFNSSIFGLSKKEIDEKLKDIIEFSELEEYIDNPVRTYSSGMYMRLAFAIAINVNADILLIDEILAVGDYNFQKKCMNKLIELKKEGKTIVFVTHTLDSIKKLCNRCIWINNGVIQEDNKTNEVLKKYIEESEKNGKSF